MSLQDKKAIWFVIGCLLKKPSLLNEDKYRLTKDDFPEQFHKIVFAAINNLVEQEIEDVDHVMIDSFLSNYDVQYKIFEDNDGLEYLIQAYENASLGNFDYHYNRLKKFSLLRSYEDSGISIDDLYDDSIINPKEKEEMQQKFDSLTLQQIVDYVDKKLLQIKEDFLVEYGAYGQQAAKGMKKLKESLKESPSMGAPLCSGILTTIARGARLKKLYMRSAPTGVGKTRFSLGDACNLAVDEIYDTDKKAWVRNGTSEPTLFITTELEMDEVQTPLIAFVSGIDEDQILDGNYTREEEERIDKAIEIIERSSLWIEHLPNFDMPDVERTIHKYILNEKVKYVFFDYIHTSLKLLESLSQQSKGMRLREDNVLLMFVDRLKQLCNRMGVFLFTATQVSGDWENNKEANQQLLRGAKAMADKLDLGIIARTPVKSDLESLKPILSKGFMKEPNMVFDIYKNRGNKLVRVRLWSYVDLGTCRTTDLFLTNNKYEVIPVEATVIEMYKDEDKQETKTTAHDF
jgi:replicative DNA helicase